MVKMIVPSVSRTFQGIQDLRAWHQVERSVKDVSLFKAWVHMAGFIQHLIKS